jgi:hypothetical protein
VSPYDVRNLQTVPEQGRRHDRQDDHQNDGEGASGAAGTGDDSTQTPKLGNAYARSQLGTLPAVRSIIAGIMSQPAAVVLVGAYGLGKSVLVHGWACCIATGKPWLGREVEQRRVLVVVGEGAYGLHERITAWETAWNDAKPVADSMLTLLVKPSSLADVATWTALTEFAVAGGYGFVVLDTFSSLAPDADETKDAALIMRHLSDLSATISGTAVLVHHPGWSDAGRTRGGYQLEGNADEVLVLAGVGGDESDIVSLTRKKRKDGPDGATVWLKLTNSARSVIFQMASADAAEVPLRVRITALLDNYGDHGATGPQLIAEVGLADADRSGFYKAMRALTADGEVATLGPRQRLTYFLAKYAPEGAV